MTPTLTPSQALNAVRSTLREQDAKLAARVSVVQDGEPEEVDYDGVEAIYWHFIIRIFDRTIATASVPDHYSDGVDITWAA